MKFIFSSTKDFTCSLRSFVKYFFHSKINFICLRHRVTFSISFTGACFYSTSRNIRLKWSAFSFASSINEIYFHGTRARLSAGQGW